MVRCSLALLLSISVGACGPGEGAGGSTGEGGSEAAGGGGASASAASSGGASASAASSGGAPVGGSDAAASSGGGSPQPVCAPGEKDERSCGACGSGKETRSCAADGGSWSSWSACSGSRSFPFEVSTKEPVCPPYTWPAVFFAPHPDDETIPMAGAIAAHVASGRPVFIELMSHGRHSGAFERLKDGASDPWHPGTHDFADMTRAELGHARVREFLDSAARMGVRGVFVSDFEDGEVKVSDVAGRVAFWLEHQDPEKGISLKGTVGSTAPDAAAAKHPDHRAVWEALTSSGHDDVRGYNSSHFGPLKILALDASACGVKRHALGAYKLWDPPAGRYAVGYHSVQGRIDEVYASCEEYVDFFKP